jgi:hypothetical protein
MSTTEKAAGRGRRFHQLGMLGNCTMSAVDIDRIASTAARIRPGSTLRQVCVRFCADYHPIRGSSSRDEEVSAVLAHPKERPSYAQFCYRFYKIAEAGKP